ncbi:MAG: hypothetical protein K0R68_3509 [Mycobacterium sp.]|nr:hypothetical protein [Mycobacterium sp.]
MARPREFDRTEALARAMNTFWERGGYERTSVSQLTAAMGISAPSLYAAFGDKRALFDEVVATYEGRPTAPANQAMPAPTTREVFARMLTAAAREYTDASHPRGCLVMGDPDLTERRDEGHTFIADRFRDGELPDSVDPETVAEFLMVMLNGLAARARDGVGAEQLQAVVEFALRSWPAEGAVSPGR